MTTPVFPQAPKTYDPTNEQQFRTALTNFLGTVLVAGANGIVLTDPSGVRWKVAIEQVTGVVSTTTPPG